MSRQSIFEVTIYGQDDCLMDKVVFDNYMDAVDFSENTRHKTFIYENHSLLTFKDRTE